MSKTKEEKTVYTVDEICSSVRYEEVRDVLKVVLDDKRTYTLEEIDKVIKAFKTKEVR